MGSGRVVYPGRRRFGSSHIFGCVWLVAHAVNECYLRLSPSATLDMLMRGARTLVLVAVSLSAFLNPWFGLIVSLLVILLAVRCFGWAWRLSAYGTTVAVDWLGFRNEPAPDATRGVRAFTARENAGLPVRSRGILRMGPTGEPEFRGRALPWMPVRVLPNSRQRERWWCVRSPACMSVCGGRTGWSVPWCCRRGSAAGRRRLAERSGWTSIWRIPWPGPCVRPSPGLRETMMIPLSDEPRLAEPPAPGARLKAAIHCLPCGHSPRFPSHHGPPWAGVSMRTPSRLGPASHSPSIIRHPSSIIRHPSSVIHHSPPAPHPAKAARSMARLLGTAVAGSSLPSNSSET